MTPIDEAGLLEKVACGALRLSEKVACGALRLSEKVACGALRLLEKVACGAFSDKAPQRPAERVALAGRRVAAGASPTGCPGARV